MRIRAQLRRKTDLGESLSARKIPQWRALHTSLPLAAEAAAPPEDVQRVDLRSASSCVLAFADRLCRVDLLDR
jgi:hypothetical protein